MIAAPSTKPTSFAELFAFYHNYVKLLYSYVQTEGALPNETLFELNAALDHVSRHWAFQESEAEAVDRAFGHLKRSCLDVFKLKLKEAARQYDELRRVDTSIIDNGQFERELRKLWQTIKQGATEARRLEGSDKGPRAFDLWEPVFVNCMNFERDFYFNSKVSWARRKGLLITIKNSLLGFLLGILASLAAAGIWTWTVKLLERRP